MTCIRSACQEEILINFESLLIDNSISNFINISCHQVDVNSFYKIFQKLLTLQPYLLLIILIDMIIYSCLIDDRNYILPYIFIICNTFL